MKMRFRGSPAGRREAADERAGYYAALVPMSMGRRNTAAMPVMLMSRWASAYLSI